MQINIPDTLYKKLEKVVKEVDDFSDVDEFIIAVLEELINDNKIDELEQEEEELLKKQLKDLGYL